MSDNSTQTKGIGIGGLLTLIFITLKLTHFIAWSWWWVLSPILIPLAISIAIMLFGLLMIGIGILVALYLGRK